MAREELYDHYVDIAEDLYTLGADAEPIDGGESDAELFTRLRASVAYGSKNMQISLEDVPTGLRTEFGWVALRLLLATTDGDFDENLRISGCKQVCQVAEPAFIRGTHTHSYDESAPLLLEDEDGVVAAMKFIPPWGEKTILALRDTDALVAGGLYGLPLHAENLVTTARPHSGVAAVSAEDFYRYVGQPLPLRPTTFALDEQIRRDFGIALGRGEGWLWSAQSMQDRMNVVLERDAHDAHVRGEQLLHNICG